MADVITDGLKHDGGKLRLDLVPPELIEAVGAVMTHGAEKYGEASYRKVDPKRYRAALMRHICKWLKDPYRVDEDSGLPHLWHIACNVAFLLELDKDINATELEAIEYCNIIKKYIDEGLGKPDGYHIIKCGGYAPFEQCKKCRYFIGLE